MLKIIDISPRLKDILCRMLPFARVKLCISWRNGVDGNPKNGMKRSHRVEPTIEPENIFI